MSSLIKIDEEIVSLAVASVTLTGIDSTYDVYMLKFNNVVADTDVVRLDLKFTVSGTPDTSLNYDLAFKDLKAAATYANDSLTNGSAIPLGFTGTGTNEQMNGIHYLFNFNNASEYSFITTEKSDLDNGNNLRGKQGGGVLKVAQACDGIQYNFTIGNIASGTFTLYGLKK